MVTEKAMLRMLIKYQGDQTRVLSKKEWDAWLSRG